MNTKSYKASNSHSFAPANAPGESTTRYLVEEYAHWQNLFEAQPVITQRFLEAQGRSLAEALIQPASQARFSLPATVVVDVSDKKESPVPEIQREQMVGGLMDRLTRTGINASVRQRLDELEASAHAAVAGSAGMVRYTTAIALVWDLLPSGRSVSYVTAEGDEIPTIPSGEDEMVESAITAATDVIAEEHTGQRDEEGRGELIVPYVPSARRFYLPQWVAFDDQDRQLVNTTAEAEAHIGSMQRFLRILHTAISVAPYMLADEVYQQKRYGMLGQLINQGRALARFQTREIIATIKRRAAANDLNRGLSLSLPYFDDQDTRNEIARF
jgi:hypothetical protein